MQQNKMKTTLSLKPLKTILKEVEMPKVNGDEVLIQVKCCGICGTDIAAYQGLHPSITLPQVLGHEFSGIIESIGPDVQTRRKGERVTAIPYHPCGTCTACLVNQYNLCRNVRFTGATEPGAFAEYVKAPEKMVFPLPDNVDYDSGALIEPASVGYHAVNRAPLNNNCPILIFGAGTIGIMCLIFAKLRGFFTVVLDINDFRLTKATEMGADKVINIYKKDNIKELLLEQDIDPNNITTIFDCVGGEGKALTTILGIIPAGGTIMEVGVYHENLQLTGMSRVADQELSIIGTTQYLPEDYKAVIRALEDLQIDPNPLLTHHFTLDQINQAFQTILSGEQELLKVMIKI